MAADTTVVHPRWEAWVAENLARGAEPQRVEAELVAEGVGTDAAHALVRRVAESAGLREASRLWRRVQALEQIVRLRGDHRARSRIERSTLPDAPTFLARHWVPGVPGVFTDLVTHWPAASRWSPRAFAERFGSVMIEACVGRDAVALPDADWDQAKVELTMAQFVARIEAGVGNDAYVIAKNAALRRPELAALVDEIALPAEIFGPAPVPDRMGLWLGGAGTHTPLHHDGDNSMFCQVFGTKRFVLAPPETLALLETARGVYSEADVAQIPEATQLELRAGEALFIPAGWWHQVDAEEPSISVSVLEFAWPNDFAWYRPGTVLRRGG